MRTSIYSSAYEKILGTGQSPREWVRQAINYDDQRPSAPHEHVATLAAGIGLLFSALMVPRRTTAVMHAAIGGALLLRAAAGRDGIRKWSHAEGARPPVDPAGGPSAVERAPADFDTRGV